MGKARDWAESRVETGVVPGLPDRGMSLQAVEELLESLDLEKSSCCMGLSRVSCPYRKAAGPSLSGHPCPDSWPFPSAANLTFPPSE